MSIARRSALASIMIRAHRAARRMRDLFDSYAAALSHALKCVYRSAQALAFISRNAGRELVARFVKADGTVRRMRFTTPAAPYVTGGVVTVCDLDNGGETRRVNLDTLAEITPAPAPADRAPVARRAADRPTPGDLDADMNEMTDDELDAHAEALFGNG